MLHATDRPPTTQRLTHNPQGQAIAFCRTPGQTPGVLFCSGFQSDMSGRKALALEQHCRAANHAFVRFDYTGHGESGGHFTDGTVSSWLADALTIFDGQTTGPQLLVGSSMGGWISLLIALARPERVAGLVLIAPAADFTEEMYWQEFDAAQREELRTTGQLSRPGPYSDEPYVITRNLIEDGRRHLLLGRREIDIRCPVRILHGMLDAAVPWQNSLLLASKLASKNVSICLRKDGDHRLSSDEDIGRLCLTLDELRNL